MRLDARCNCGVWFVWHCGLAQSPKHVVWVDDESNQWGQYVLVLVSELGEVPILVHQASKVAIIESSHTILIDPIEGVNDGADTREPVYIKAPA